MTALTALARAIAVREERAQPLTTVRHVHIGARPLVFVPLALAGEANAPLAALVGDDRAAPHLLVVPQPRNRAQRFAFAAELGHLVLDYLRSFTHFREDVPINRGREVRQRFSDAPQLIVPNPAGVAFTRLLGRSTRLRRTDGPYAVDPVVPLLGRWLTFLAERAEHPGSSLMVAMTRALSMHWATGQSSTEDANLAALLGWIAPPEGRSPVEAAADAEDADLWPPAGPATDPTFDNEILSPAIARHERDPRHFDGLRKVLNSQLEPTWHLMWRGIDVLGGLSPGASVAERWADDRDSFTNYVTYLAGDNPLPQARRDSATAAARRLSTMERAQNVYDVQRAMDDPLVMAEYRLGGEAFAGTVTYAAPDRIDASSGRRKLRPQILVHTDDPLRLTPGATVSDRSRPKQKAVIVRVSTLDSGGYEVQLELSGGMGNSLVAPPGSVPAVGERLTYSALDAAFRQPDRFPANEETPWTHGGPPQQYVPTNDDAVEDWS
ncbi:hypothetical protein Val02_86470 [Virgisporangium aliadipatigenens]|uniref:Uncharacterized protein n=1 Tax=Virgisporangium aliadipatigenens TaxID=741659 RepID=A0A8J4DVS9_9ACTN|nr:hypothetical protein [Virgisporangium aliadipatigenens]GIJ51761.1 hypothetical protein Val02_86470 [Virgisporangium aliadipatigenens]